MANGDDFDERWNGASIPRNHWHFHRRLFERYAIVLAPGEYSGLLKDIKGGYVQLVKKRASRPSIYCVWIRSADQRVFLIASRHRLFTVLPQSTRIVRRLSQSV
jgi:hypothetical protein